MKGYSYNRKVIKPGSWAFVRGLAVLMCLVIGAGCWGWLPALQSSPADSGIYAYGLSAEPVITAEGAVLINAETGSVFYEKNKDAKMYPASTTKVLTALVVLDKMTLETIVTADAETAHTEGSRMYLQEGEQLTIGQLLNAMLLVSANDAAVALAKATAGSVDAFATLMNEKARSLGAVNSNFVNPNGLPDEEHYTTPYDLALIAKAAMTNDTFRQIVSTYEYVIPATDKYAARTLHNTNRLLFDETTLMYTDGSSDRTLKYDGATGIKTGYTQAAGSCLVAGAERDGTEFISVVMKSQNERHFADSILLLDYGFNNYAFRRYHDAWDKVGSIKVRGSRTNWMDVVCTEDVGDIVSVDEGSDVLTDDIQIDNKIQAPFEAGTKVGTLTLYHSGVPVKEYDLVTADGAEQSNLSKLITGITDHAPVFLLFLAGVILILIILYITFVILINRRARQKRREREEKRRQRNESDNISQDQLDKFLKANSMSEGMAEPTNEPKKYTDELPKWK